MPVSSNPYMYAGATVVDLTAAGLKKPCLIKRKDGASLYATRDLASADDRFQEYKFNRGLYVVDAGQALHFQVLLVLTLCCWFLKSATPGVVRRRQTPQAPLC